MTNTRSSMPCPQDWLSMNREVGPAVLCGPGPRRATDKGTSNRDRGGQRTARPTFGSWSQCTMAKSWELSLNPGETVPLARALAFAKAGVDCGEMDFHEILRSCQEFWENKPRMVVLLSAGFLVFVFLVVDTWRQKRRRRRARQLGQR